MTSSLVPKDEADEERKDWGEGQSKCRRILILICFTYCAFWETTCYSLLGPFFPREAELKGATATQYGLVFAIFELAVIFMSPISGKMLSTISPKTMVVCGVLLEGGACLLFGILDQVPAGNTFIGLAFAVRFIEGSGAAISAIASTAIISANFPNSIGKTFSLLESAVGFGAIAGPTVGGALYEAGGYFLPFAVTGGILMSSAVFLWCLLPTTEIPDSKPSGNVKDFLRSWKLLIYSLAIITSMLFVGFCAATLEPHLRRFHLTPAVLGTVFIVDGSIYAFTAPIMGWLVDKGADTFSMLATGYFLTALGLLFIGPAPFLPFTAKIWTVVLSLLSIGLGLSIKVVSSYSGALKSTLDRGFPDNMATYGMVSAFFCVATSLGCFIGPSLGGLLLDTIGYRPGTLILFAEEVILMISMIAYIVWQKCKNSSALEKIPLLRKSSLKGKDFVNSSVSQM